jgi:hypothetical protein
MPWYAVPLIAPCAVVIVIVMAVAIRPGVSKQLAEVLREVPPVLTALVPGLKILSPSERIRHIRKGR